MNCALQRRISGYLYPGYEVLESKTNEKRNTIFVRWTGPKALCFSSTVLI